MTLRNMTSAMAATVLAIGLIAGPAMGKPCRRLCHDAVKTCRAAVPPNTDCTGTRPEKKTCRKDHRLAKQACHKDIFDKCHANTDTTVCSPSGAFVGLSFDVQ